MREIERGKSRVWLLVLFVFLIPLVFLLCSTALGRRSRQEGLKLARQSVSRAAVQCYALEGFYPRSLDYLTSRYGVAVDRDHYFIDYQYVASNLMPDITVLELVGPD